MKRDIVIIGIQAWDIEIGSNCKNIALELSKTNRVLYVNYHDVLRNPLASAEQIAPFLAQGLKPAAMAAVVFFTKKHVAPMVAPLDT